MAEHRIRLRGAWEWSSIDGATQVPRRIKLPTLWTLDPGSPFRLTRHLGRPAIDPSHERIYLELLQVPGLLAIRWNGQEFGRLFEDSERWEVPISDFLLARNSLELDVDFRSIEPQRWLQDWGDVALVISRLPVG